MILTVLISRKRWRCLMINIIGCESDSYRKKLCLFCIHNCANSTNSYILLYPPPPSFFRILFDCGTYSVREFVREWKILEDALFVSFGLGELVRETPIQRDNLDLAPPNTPDIRKSGEIIVLEIPPRIERELMTLHNAYAGSSK